MESNIDKKMSKIVFLCCLFWFIVARAARLQLLHNCKQRDGEIRPGPGTGSRQQPGTVRMSAWILAGAGADGGAGAVASAGQDTEGRMTDGSCAAHSIHQSPAPPLRARDLEPAQLRNSLRAHSSSSSSSCSAARRAPWRPCT